jgi:hypothetical protein
MLSNYFKTAWTQSGSKQILQSHQQQWFGMGIGHSNSVVTWFQHERSYERFQKIMIPFIESWTITRVMVWKMVSEDVPAPLSVFSGQSPTKKMNITI